MLPSLCLVVTYTDHNTICLFNCFNTADSSVGSRTPSPTFVRSPNGSRSPSPAAELAIDQLRTDSITPDRDSLHIDMVTGPDEETMTGAG